MAMNFLRRRELLLSLKYATIEACFSVPMLNLTTGNLPFALGFGVEALHWGPGAIGFLAATPHIANFLQPPITYFLQRRLSLYRIMLLTFVMNALPWAFVATFPFWTRGRDLAIAAVVLASSSANSVCAVAWSASMSQLVPLEIRGKYFGRRNMTFGFWTLLVVLVAGQFVDYFHSSMAAFGVVFSLAAAMRLTGMYFLTRMKFPRAVTERRDEASSLADFLAPLRDRNYFWLLCFIGMWGFFLNLGLPFYTVYLLEELPFTMSSVTVLITLSSLGGLVSLRTWGALSDRFGNKPVLIACALLWSSNAMAFWLFAGPSRHLHLYLNYFLTGFTTAGFQLCQFNLMIKLVPTEKKSHYISVFLAFTSFITALGPLAGGRLLVWLPHRMGSFLGQPLLSYHVLFGISLLLCLVSVNILQGLREPAERPLRDLVRVMSNMREFNPVLGMASLAQFMFTPRGITQLARRSARLLRRQTSAVSEVGEELMGGGWRALKQPFEKEDDGSKD